MRTDKVKVKRTETQGLGGTKKIEVEGSIGNRVHIFVDCVIKRERERVKKKKTQRVCK